MSRVAKAPVLVPGNVEVIIEQNSVSVKGPKGTLMQRCNALVSVTQEKDKDHILSFAPANEDPNAWAQAGTMRALVNNMVTGVTTGFTITLELVGVGYRAQPRGKDITLSLGFSHNIE